MAKTWPGRGHFPDHPLDTSRRPYRAWRLRFRAPLAAPRWRSSVSDHPPSPSVRWGGQRRSGGVDVGEVRGKEGGGGLVVRVARRDLEVMEWIGAQYAVREDQLARLLGRSERTARRWARVMCDAGYCRREWLLAGDPAWVWLAGHGARTTELGFRPWRPSLGRLRHIAAVNELRLHLTERLPDACWISERELLR